MDDAADQSLSQSKLMRVKTQKKGAMFLLHIVISPQCRTHRGYSGRKSVMELLRIVSDGVTSTGRCYSKIGLQTCCQGDSKHYVVESLAWEKFSKLGDSCVICQTKLLL